MDFLRLDEIPRYLEACSTAYRPLAEVLVACGLRISEALHLTWTDIDLDGQASLVARGRCSRLRTVAGSAAIPSPGGWHKAALRDADLRETLRLHDLRHTAGASRLAAGLPLIYVQRQLGHASITTTEAQYGHLEKGFLRGAAKRAEAAVWEGRVEAPAAAFA